MTALENRPRTALLVVDVQNGVVGNAYDRDRVVGNIRQLVDKARAEQVPVVWVQHSDDDLAQGSEEWQYVPELARLDTEPLVHETHGDSFEDTDLEEHLAGLAVGRLVVTGAQTDTYWGFAGPPGRRHPHRGGRLHRRLSGPRVASRAGAPGWTRTTGGTSVGGGAGGGGGGSW